MQLSTHTDYALRSLIYLALQPTQTPVTVQDIARRYGISAHHVAKVAQTLSQHGYVQSLRGRGGGLVLARAPKDIRVGTLVRETENLKLLECFGPDSTCPIDPACRLKQALKQAHDAFMAVLDGYTLADMVANERELRGLLFRG
ncbi:Rrf2 family transcriptional regulator [Alcanivorax sp. JB21]|uniref:RrF2 family transcriptional regulator n=1 Tax=Alcanivorax limicola TaxID=2874102 RepID=UPI001CBD492F|nr:Rrf2 family transcriptional regulator [Alcanivorax limicola]MBZ2188281.1 Rrf2 family transcriptional regulator [Alcanivorax limicola]